MKYLQAYLNNNSTPDFDTEIELLKKGIIWLSKHYINRDLMMDVSKGFASQYAVRQLRVIRRVEDFITINPKNLKWLHDFLLTENLDTDIFKEFFKLWSMYYRVNNNLEGKTINVIRREL